MTIVTGYKAKKPDGTIVDLGSLFQNITTTTSSSVKTTVTTNYDVSGVDLNNYFYSISYGTSIGYTIGYTTLVSGKYTDLSKIFAADGSLNTLTSTSGMLSVHSKLDKIAENFIMPTSYNYFNFYIYGAGGDGGTPNPNGGNMGGAGSGAFIKALNIPYKSNNIIITSISYFISANAQGDTYVTIYYSDNSSIELVAGVGSSNRSNTFTSGASGGTYSFKNKTTNNFYSSNYITGVNGAQGGGADRSSFGGTSNGHTSSGSAGNQYGPGGQVTGGIDSTYVSNTINAPDYTYTITSQGGGTNKTPSGFGAGGAATSQNYKGNASAYRAGTQGVIVYYLSK